MKRILLTMSLGAALATSVNAQQAPPVPPTPPEPPAAPAAPPPPAAELFAAMPFSVSFGGNYLGIRVSELTNEVRTRAGLAAGAGGVLITEVTPDSPAARAGLRKDDVIVRIDDERVTNTSKLTRLISEAAPESTLRLTINRAGSEQQLTATLGTREGAARALGDRFAERFRALRAIPDTADIERRARESAERAREYAERAREHGEFAREMPNFYFGNARRLGVSTIPLTKQLADYFDVKMGRGLLVTNVAEDSAAARSGIKAGDVIIEVGDAQIGSVSNLTRELSRKQEGEVELKVVRGGRERTIKATPERSRESSFNFERFAPLRSLNGATPLRPSAPRAIAPRAFTPRVAPVPVTPRIATPRGRIL